MQVGGNYLYLRDQFSSLEKCLNNVFSGAGSDYLHVACVKNKHPRLYWLTKFLRKCWTISGAALFLFSGLTFAFVSLWPILAVLFATCMASMLLEFFLMTHLPLEEKHLLVKGGAPCQAEKSWTRIDEFTNLIKHPATRTRLEKIVASMHKSYYDSSQKDNISWDKEHPRLYKTWVLAACYGELDEKERGELEDSLGYLEHIFRIQGQRKLCKLQ